MKKGVIILVFLITLSAQGQATGAYSTVMGYSTTASGHTSTAMGYLSEASGSHSTAMGRDTKASGSASTASIGSGLGSATSPSACTCGSTS